MTLTILEVLYIFLIAFTAIIWTLLVVVLMRVLKILAVVQEITWIYEKIKSVFNTYSKIPNTIKDVVKEKFGRKNK